MIAYFTAVFLVSGFLFTRQYPIAKFKQLRCRDWTTYCHIFSWGVFWGVLSIVLIMLLDFICSNFVWLNTIRNSIGSFLYYPLAYIRKLSLQYRVNDTFIIWSALTPSLSAFFGFISTKFYCIRKKAIENISKESDLLNKLFESTQNGDFVQITLRSRKVYVGLVVDNRNDKLESNVEYIVLRPYRSGYRNSVDLTIEFTNLYSNAYEKIDRQFRSAAWFYLKNKAEHSSNKIYRKKILKAYNCNFDEESYKKELDRYSVVIPISEIVQISAFDLNAYEQINNNIHIKAHFSYNYLL